MTKIAVNKILPNPEQPRKRFDNAELRELADSMGENGLVQAITVEESDGHYILHDGERRWRAAKLLGWTEIEANVQPPLNGTGRSDRLVRAMVANLQRADLDPIEEAQAYQKMVDELGMNKSEVSRKTGKNLNLVDGRLKLLELESQIQELVAQKRLHCDRRLAEALLEIPDSAARVKAAERLSASGASLKQAIVACEKVAQAIREQSRIEGTPALEIAGQRVRVKRLPPLKWDMLRQVKQVPPWAVVVSAAKETCAACPLRSMASEKTCGDCPAVELLRRMVESVQ